MVPELATADEPGAIRAKVNSMVAKRAAGDNV
jgi:hypothetical protein